MSKIFNLSKKVVIITGASGTLGQIYGHALQQEGVEVVALDLEIKKDSKDGFHWIKADITCKDELMSAASEIKKKFGRIDGLINNAAIDTPPNKNADSGAFETFSEEIWDKVHEVNTKGTFLCCQVFGSIMAKQGSGSIINIGSIYGIVSPDQSIYDYIRKDYKEFFKPVAYSSSKSALYNFTKYLGVYWAKQGVRVNILTLAGVEGNQDPRFKEAYCGRIPMGRMAKENDYIGAVIFLLSDASSYMTGSELRIDGGWTAI